MGDLPKAIFFYLLDQSFMFIKNIFHYVQLPAYNNIDVTKYSYLYLFLATMTKQNSSRVDVCAFY